MPGKGEGCWPVTAQGPCLGGLLSSGGGRRCVSLSGIITHRCQKGTFPARPPRQDLGISILSSEQQPGRPGMRQEG